MVLTIYQKGVRMKVISSLFVTVFAALLIVTSAPLTADATQVPDVKTGQPASKAEWDKLVAYAKKEV